MEQQSTFAKTRLDNQLTVISERIPSVRSVSIGVWIRTGSRNEIHEKNGISHFIEHMTFKGTARRSAEKIAQSLESVGGHLNAFTSKELTCYYARVLDEHVSIAVDVLADILFHSLFKEEDMEKERHVILEEIKNLEDTPDELIHDLFSKSLFEPHPLAWPILGPSENIKRFSVHDLRRFIEDQYTTNKMVIAAAGNIEHDELINMIQKHFHVSHIGQENGTEELPHMSMRVDIITKNIAQTHLCLGTRSYPYARPQRFPLLVLNTLLGGGMSSRLFQKIREKEGLAYSIFTFFDFFFDTGIFGAYAGTDSSQIRKVLTMILNELGNLVSEPVTDEELSRTKSQLKGSLMLGLENTSNRMIRLAKLETYLGSYSGLDETLADIDRVTAEEVQRIAIDLFHPQKLTVTILGPVKEDIVTRDDLFVN